MWCSTYIIKTLIISTSGSPPGFLNTRLSNYRSLAGVRQTTPSIMSFTYTVQLLPLNPHRDNSLRRTSNQI